MLRSINGFIRSWKRFNASFSELSSLSDRQLAARGMRREDIPQRAVDSARI
jgi:uncharacterized protein YjiS (DUF1127 family)